MESARPRETTKKEPEGAKEMGSAHASRLLLRRMLDTACCKTKFLKPPSVLDLQEHLPGFGHSKCRPQSQNTQMIYVNE